MGLWEDAMKQAEEFSPLIAGLMAAGHVQKAEELRKQVLDGAKGLDPNQLEKINASLAGPSDFNSFKEDPALRQHEMEALGRLRDVANNGGMDAVARAHLAEARNEASNFERGQRDALTNDFSERGMGGGGAELAAQLQSQQGAANREAMGGVQAAADAESRALQAIRDSSGIAGRVRGEDSDVAKFKSNANDAISRFNAGQSQQANVYNSDLGKAKFGQQALRQRAIADASGSEEGAEEGKAKRDRDFFGKALSAAMKGLG